MFAQDKLREWLSWTGDQRMERSLAGQETVLSSQQSRADKFRAAGSGEQTLRRGKEITLGDVRVVHKLVPFLRIGCIFGMALRVSI